MSGKRENYELSEKEYEVIEHLRRLEYGKMVVTVRDGEPCHIEIQKSIQLK